MKEEFKEDNVDKIIEVGNLKDSFDLKRKGARNRK